MNNLEDPRVFEAKRLVEGAKNALSVAQKNLDQALMDASGCEWGDHSMLTISLDRAQGAIRAMCDSCNKRIETEAELEKCLTKLPDYNLIPF